MRLVEISTTTRPVTFLLLLAVSLSSGCASLKEKTWQAAKEPQTWVPLIGAAIIASTNLDDEIAESAQRDGPVFRDPQGSSNDLRDLLAISYGASALFGPQNDGRNRFKAIAANVGGYAATNLSVGALKELSNRRRPDGTSETSFPSGHAANASYLASATWSNLEGLSWPRWGRTALNVSLQGAAAGVGWGRIEAGKHHPSDVLAGYALGHFFATFVDVSLGEQRDDLRVRAQALPRGIVVKLHLRLP